MKIAIIGRGRVAEGLRAALSRHHSIRLGVRDVRTASEAPIAEAASWAEVVIVSTPWSALDSVAAALAGHVDAKPVIDTVNPVGMTEHGLGLVDTGAASAAEALQARLPTARVVKAFNQIGAEHLAAAAALAAPPVMFAAGDDDAAKATALRLAQEAGFDARDGGPLANAHLLEALAMLWIWSATRTPLGRGFGFSLTYPSA